MGFLGSKGPVGRVTGVPGVEGVLHWVNRIGFSFSVFTKGISHHRSLDIALI